MEKLLSELVYVQGGCTCIAESDNFEKGYIVKARCTFCQGIQDIDNVAITKQKRRQEILQELNELDRRAIRPIIDNEVEQIEMIRLAKIALRTELATL